MNRSSEIGLQRAGTKVVSIERSDRRNNSQNDGRSHEE